MITEKEFKELFDLGDDCVIPKNTLKQYYRQIKGAYLLYLEILNVDKLKFKNADNTPLRAYFEPYERGFQHFVDSLGSKSKFHVYYVEKDGERTTPFWTYTKYSHENNEVEHYKNSAYQIFIARHLSRLLAKYVKYNISFSFRDYATTNRNHPNNSIWWDGVIFTPLFYKNGKVHRQLSHYEIAHTITNREDIWNQPIPEPVKNIINEIKKDEKYKKMAEYA